MTQTTSPQEQAFEEWLRPRGLRLTDPEPQGRADYIVAESAFLAGWDARDEEVAKLREALEEARIALGYRSKLDPDR